MDMKLVVILLQVSLVLCADWSNPVPLHSDRYTGYSPGVASNISYGSTFLFIGYQKTDPERQFKYGFVNYDGTVRQFHMINEASGCTYGSLMRMDNYYLISICVGTRKPGSTNAACDPSLTNGCNEVFYMESRNDGDTWSNPMPSKRKNMSDVVHRAGPSLTYSSFAGRLFVFYSTNQLFGTTNISYIMRAPNSATFTPESHVLALPVSLDEPSILSAATLHGTKPTLHLAWKQGDYITYTYSSNNGISWVDTDNITTASSIYKQIPALQLFTFQESPSLVCMLNVDSNSNGMIQCTNTIFFSRHIEPKLISEKVAYINGAVCKGKGKVFIVARTVDRTISTFLYDVNTKEVTQIGTQLFNKTSTYEMPQAECKVQGKEATLIAVAFDSKNLTEYLTYNTIAL